MDQDAVLLRYLVRRSYENAAGSIGHVGFDACGNEPHDLVVEKLPVTGVIFVPDHQVHRQSFQTPVRVGLHELAHQVDIGRIFNLQQHNRQIAGNGVSPETGLPAAVLDEDARVGAQRGIGVDDRAGKASIELRIGLCGIELAQQHLAMCPCQIEDAIRETPILVFFHQAQGGIAGFTDAGDHIYRCRFFRIERYPIADGDNRIEHGALAARERPRIKAGTPLIACGSATVFPRPMNCMRSVS